MPALTSITDEVKRAASEAGFDLCGIAPVREFAELARFPDWIAAGRAGDMSYLESRSGSGRLKRASLANTVPWARSVVVCAINYNTAQPCSTETPRETRGWISRYAWSQRDYHDVVMEALRQVESRLHALAGPEVQTRCYVDTGPLVERVYARYAGVGWIGKNTCIISQQLGSWLFLGVILTSADTASPGAEPGTALLHDLPAPDRCGTCTRCLDACPTNAFVGPHELDASRCISYLTIEKRGAIPEDLRAGMGRHVFGCDICQDVCPWNRRASIASGPDFQPRAGLLNPDPVWLATISEEEFRQTFRGSPIKRAKRSGLRRNAVIALGNSGDARHAPLLRELTADPDEMVAAHARWALARLAETVPSPDERKLL